MRHRAVFFDFGGTLFSYHAVGIHVDRSLESLARRRGLAQPLQELRRLYWTAVTGVLAAYVDRSFYLHRDLFAEAQAAFLASVGLAPDADDEGVLRTGGRLLRAAAVQAREGAGDALAGLRARGLHVAVVSNIDKDQFDALWPRVGLGRFVDAVTTSEEACSCKPDPGIFRLALAKAGDPPPETVVFVGDSVDHDVAGANALGMTSVLIGTPPPGATNRRRPRHVISDLRELLEIVEA